MENQKEKIVSIMAMIAFALMVVTATYAYFQARVGDPAAVDVKLNANTVDTFTFSTGKAISINLNQESFASGTGNLTGSTTATATLTANSYTNTATENYYLYLNISENTYTYSIDEDTPEIILTVTDSSGNEVTDISGLNHVGVTGATGSAVSGYDITNKSGLITLLNNREITTTSSKEDVWTVTITFINYDANQAANAGKSMSAKVMIQKGTLKLDKVCSNGQKLSSCIMSMNGIDGTLYYHNGTITDSAGTTVIDANDGSYRYAGENPNNYVCFGSDATPCPTDNLYRIIGVFDGKVKLIKYDYATSTQLGGSDVRTYYGAYSYGNSTYKGSNYSNVASYYLNNNTGYNTWSESNLNTVNLNTNYISYLNGINTKWADMIADATWKIGGNTWANIAESAMYLAYQNEIVNPSLGSYSRDNATEYGPNDGVSKIGLMYVSDYGYAASQTYWTYPGYSSSGASSDYRAATTSNWMYIGLYEWTVSRASGTLFNAFIVSTDGSVNFINVGNNNVAVRPVFYLESTATYSSGNGSSNNPIKLG